MSYFRKPFLMAFLGFCYSKLPSFLFCQNRCQLLLSAKKVQESQVYLKQTIIISGFANSLEKRSLEYKKFLCSDNHLSFLFYRSTHHLKGTQNTGISRPNLFIENLGFWSLWPRPLLSLSLWWSPFCVSNPKVINIKVSFKILYFLATLGRRPSADSPK